MGAVLGRRMGLSQQSASAAAGESESATADGDGPGHHECERRIPVAGQIEEAEDLDGIGHPRNDEFNAEQQSGCEADQRNHARSPCRTRKTVRNPVAMKVRTAAAERGEPLERPHTP